MEVKFDYSSLCSKAIRKILPHLKDGLDYSVACEYAGYRHSKNSLTKEEIVNKVLTNYIKNKTNNKYDLDVCNYCCYPVDCRAGVL